MLKTKARQKILIVSYDFAPRLGGVATCALEICRALSDAPNVEVRVIAPAGNHFDCDRVQKFKILRVPFSLGPRLAILTFTARIFLEILYWRPNAIVDLLWLPDGLATFLATKLFFWRSTPYFLFAHGVEIFESEMTLKKRLRKKLSFIKKHVFYKAAGVFAVSSFTKNAVCANCKIPEDKITVVNNGVNLSEFLPDLKSPELVQKLSIQDKTIFLSVCRLYNYKGIDQALRAMRLLKLERQDFAYLIIGTGPDRSRLEQLTKKYNLNEQVRFLDKVEGRDLAKYYNLADCFILLCREDRWTPNVEGFGIVFLEAAACAKPVIAGASGGVSDAVADGFSGWLVPPRNTSVITEKLRGVMENKEQASSFGKNGRDRVENKFTWQASAQKILKGMEAHVRD